MGISVASHCSFSAVRPPVPHCRTGGRRPDRGRPPPAGRKSGRAYGICSADFHGPSASWREAVLPPPRPAATLRREPPGLSMRGPVDSVPSPFNVYASWGGRPQTAAQAAARTGEFLRVLATLHPALGSWWDNRTADAVLPGTDGFRAMVEAGRPDPRGEIGRAACRGRGEIS